MNQSIYSKVAIGVWAIGFVVVPLLWVFFGAQYAQNYLLGAATSMLNLSLLIKSSRNALERPEGRRQGYIMSQQALRMGLYIAVLIAAFVVGFDPLGYLFLLFGLLSVKIVLVVYTLFNGGNL
jgi:hypothetical protein